MAGTQGEALLAMSGGQLLLSGGRLVPALCRRCSCLCSVHDMGVERPWSSFTPPPTIPFITARRRRTPGRTHGQATHTPAPHTLLASTHTGTVPMDMRRDAMAAAAEGIAMIEATCNGLPVVLGGPGSEAEQSLYDAGQFLRCTVGRLVAHPGQVGGGMECVCW